MPKTLDEILADSSIPDTTEVDFAGNKVPLGSLRTFTKSQLDSINARSKQIDDDSKAAKAARDEAFRLSQEAQKLFESLESRRPDPAAASGSDDSYDTDPLYAPVRKRLSAQEKKYADDMAKLAKLEQTINNLALIGGWDRWERQLERFPKDLRPKDKSLEDLVKYANENKLIDRFGVPSVELALEKLTADQRQKVAADEAYARGQKEAEARLRASMVPKPNFNPSPASGNKTQVLEDLDHLTDKALEDPELREMIQGLNMA